MQLRKLYRDNLSNVRVAFADALQTNTNLLLQMNNIVHSIKGTSHKTTKIVEAINNCNISDNHTDLTSSPVTSSILNNSSQYQYAIILNVSSSLFSNKFKTTIAKSYLFNPDDFRSFRSHSSKCLVSKFLDLF